MKYRGYELWGEEFDTTRLDLSNIETIDLLLDARFLLKEELYIEYNNKLYKLGSSDLCRQVTTFQPNAKSPEAYLRPYNYGIIYAPLGAVIEDDSIIIISDVTDG